MAEYFPVVASGSITSLSISAAMSTQLDCVAALSGVVEVELTTAYAEPVTSVFGFCTVALEVATPTGIATT